MAKQPYRPAPQPQQQARKTAPAYGPSAGKPCPLRRPAEKRDNLFSAGSRELIFGRQNFILMGIGLALVLIGLATMSGGAMTDPNEWKPEQIYSPMRITVAPILMLAGFVTVIFGIFKRKPGAADSSNFTEA